MATLHELGFWVPNEPELFGLRDNYVFWDSRRNACHLPTAIGAAINALNGETIDCHKRFCCDDPIYLKGPFLKDPLWQERLSAVKEFSQKIKQKWGSPEVQGGPFNEERCREIVERQHKENWRQFTSLYFATDKRQIEHASLLYFSCNILLNCDELSVFNLEYPPESKQEIGMDAVERIAAIGTLIGNDY